VRKLIVDGELDRCLRAVDPERATIVHRIFENYVAGASPRRIARALNDAGIAGPGGRPWYDASILGRPNRGDGILRNELYIGRLIWRRVNAKDPTSGKRRHCDARPETHPTQGITAAAHHR
jgi:hypothetical protein